MIKYILQATIYNIIKPSIINIFMHPIYDYVIKTMIKQYLSLQTG